MTEVWGLLKGPRSSGTFDAQICILPYSRVSFSFIPSKTDKNRTIHCTSINLRFLLLHTGHWKIRNSSISLS